MAFAVVAATLPALGAPQLQVEQAEGTPLDGKIVVWGSNYYEQHTVPAALAEAVAVDAGGGHLLGLRRDGTVVAWGQNDHGQATVPEGLSGVTAIAAGIHHSMAMKSDGTVVAWGSNTTSQSTVPPTIADAVGIAADWRHGLIVRSNGAVVPIGRESSTGETIFPLRSSVRDVVSASCGGLHNLALKRDGSVVAWGIPGLNNLDPPPGLTGVKGIAAGYQWSLALRSDGTVAGWGEAGSPWLPVPAGLNDVIAIDAGRFHSAALKNDGSIVCWGENHWGELDVPAGKTDFYALSAGYQMTAALQRTRAFGNQPVETTSSAKSFVVKNTGSTPLAIQGVSVTGDHSEDFAIDVSGLPGEISADGASAAFSVSFTPSTAGPREVVLHLASDDPVNPSYDIVLTGTGLGPEIDVIGAADILDGDFSPSPADETDFGPANIAGESVVRTFTIVNRGTTPLHLIGTPRVAIDGPHAADFAITAAPDATIAPGGGSTRLELTFLPGALGLRSAVVTLANDDNTEPAFSFAVQGTGVVAPEFGIEQAGGVPIGGRVVAWGNADGGGTSVPSALVTVAAIAAGDGYGLALRHDGRVSPWGANAWGQTSLPAGLTGVKAIAAGTTHAIALKSDQTVVAWGQAVTTSNRPPPGLTGVTAIAAQYFRSVALKADGTVVQWGSGLEPLPDSWTGVRAIAAGRGYTMGLRNDGRVVTWGTTSNGFGGSTISPPADLTGVKAIAAGWDHAAAVKRDGTVVVWGSGRTTHNAPPDGLAQVTDVAAGENWTLARLATGRLVAWGWHQNQAPAVPDGLHPVSAIAAGRDTGLALQPMVALGAQPVGGLASRSFTIRNSGNGPLTVSEVRLGGAQAADYELDTTTLTKVVPPAGETAFTVHFRARAPGVREAVLEVINDDADEGIFAFLLQGSGTGADIAVAGRGIEIANGSTLPSLAEDTDFGRADVTEGQAVRTFTITNTGNSALNLPGTPRVALGGSDAADFSVVAEPAPLVAARTGSTTLTIAFNPNAHGLRSATVTILSNASHESPFVFAIQGTGVDAPAISVEQPMPSGPQETVLAWGRNDEGQVQIPANLAPVTRVAAGRYHTVALLWDGTVAAWGDPTYGQPAVPAAAVGVKSIAVGDYHSLALRNDGRVVAWGRGDTRQTSVPAALDSVIAVAAGREHSLALKSDGKVVAWGGNGNNQSTVPGTLSDVVAIAAGYVHSLALKNDGRVVAWGSSTYGQSNVPSNLADVTAIAAGHYHSLALKRDGSVVAWGRNDHGQRNVPAGLSGVVAIAADYSQSLALLGDGSLVAWGLNDSGQGDIPRQLRPLTSIEAGGFHTVALQPVLFAAQELGTTSPPKEFILKNSGRGPLTITRLTLSGADAGDFAIEAAGWSNPLPAFTGSLAVPVTFTPGGARVSRAVLTIESDDIEEGIMEIWLTGTGVVDSPYARWAASAGLRDADALPLATPLGDGTANLLKYAFNLPPNIPGAPILEAGTGTAGLPSVSLVATPSSATLRVEFVRRRDSSLVYTPQWGTTLDVFRPMTAPPTVVPIDANWDRVIVEESLGRPPLLQAFGRVLVHRP